MFLESYIKKYPAQLSLHVLQWIITYFYLELENEITYGTGKSQDPKKK